MDIRCPICGEPTDMDELHYIDPEPTDGDDVIRIDRHGEPWLTFDEARKRYRERGCAVFGPAAWCQPRSVGRIVAELWDLAGDDIDGLAADLEDADLFGLL